MGAEPGPEVPGTRDPAVASALARRIAAGCEPDRAYRIMEVCGGHTHAFYRYGLEAHLPDAIRLVHGPGCPVCVLPRGRLDDAIELAVEGDLTLCTFGDVVRVPGTEGSLLEARGRGADVRIVYSPLDALALARADPDREVVFLAIGFETTAPATAATVRRAAEQGVANFSVLCNHVLVVPPVTALLDDPAVDLDGLIGPGHVSTVIGTRPYEPVCERFGVPVVVSGFEPNDLLEAIAMVVEQVGEGRAEVANQYRRAVTREGNPVALALLDEVFAVRDEFEWRGLGSHRALPRSGWHRATRPSTPSGVTGSSAGRWPTPRPAAAATCCRGVIEPPECKVFGTACTPEHPIGSCMVSSEGACRGPLPVPGRAGRGVGPHGRAGAVSGAESITMAHGAGGTTSRRLIEDEILPRLGFAPASALLDAAVVAVGGTPVALTTDAFVVRPLVFPGGSIGSLAVHGTLNDLAVSGARPVALSVALVLEEGLAVDVLRRELDAMAGAAAAAGVAVVTGDTKVVPRGAADGMYVVTTGVGTPVAAEPLDPARMVAGDRVLLSGPVGDHGMAVLLARGELGVGGEIRSDSASGSCRPRSKIGTGVAWAASRWPPGRPGPRWARWSRASSRRSRACRSRSFRAG